MEGVKTTKNNFIGSAGEDAVKYYLKNENISCVSSESSDFGEDIICDIFVNSDEKNIFLRTNKSFRVQVKTTDDINQKQYKISADSFSVPIKLSLINLWEESYFPIIIVLWDKTNHKGYWSTLNSSKKNQKTARIKFNKDNSFIDNIGNIKKYVEEYYTNLFKIMSSKMKCNIYPIVMPQYRLLTIFDMYKLQNRIKNLKIESNDINKLPSFFASYNSLNLNGEFSSFVFENIGESIDDFLKSIELQLFNISKLSTYKSTWMSFIISPIEIIATGALQNY